MVHEIVVAGLLVNFAMALAFVGSSKSATAGITRKWFL
jgi:hypothetical protein